MRLEIDSDTIWKGPIFSMRCIWNFPDPIWNLEMRCNWNLAKAQFEIVLDFFRQNLERVF